MTEKGEKGGGGGVQYITAQDERKGYRGAGWGRLEEFGKSGWGVGGKTGSMNCQGRWYKKVHVPGTKKKRSSMLLPTRSPVIYPRVRSAKLNPGAE